MVTVVDAANFMTEYEKADDLSERGVAVGDEDERTVVDLLVEQVEFADVILLNKTDLAGEEESARVEAIVSHLNPEATILRTQFGRVPIDQILNTGLFDFEEAARSPGWLQELNGEHVPETEEYGISSFVFRARRPFHPERLWAWIRQSHDGVLRSKGFFWIAPRHHTAFLWSQAGGASRVEPAGTWWAATPKEHWPEFEDVLQEIQANWSHPFGDRRQELVFIGQSMDRAKIESSLNSCLLTDEEMRAGATSWSRLPNPFPHWNPVEQHTHDDHV
jgi:G3E family GTPase